MITDLSDNAQAFVNNLPFRPRDLIHPMYPNDGIKTVLSDFFGETTLGQVKSGKSALVTTLRLFSEDKNWAPLVLHNMGPNEAAAKTSVEDRPARSTRLVDAALCTARPRCTFRPTSTPTSATVSMAASSRTARRRSPLASPAGPVEETSITSASFRSGLDRRSAGSTFPGRSLSSSRRITARRSAWLAPIHRGEMLPGDTKERLTPAFPLISALFDASSASHNYICMQALDTNYCRVRVNLPKPIALDDTSEEALSFLEKADRLISPQRVEGQRTGSRGCSNPEGAGWAGDGGSGRGQRAEGRGQRAEGRGQRAEGRGQRAEGKAEDRGQKAEGGGMKIQRDGVLPGSSLLCLLSLEL